MELGQFSVSLAVKDIAKSLAFYEALGFEALPECGGVGDKWLILQKDTTVIGLFEGMFEKNTLTFNPTDVRQVQQTLSDKGLTISTKVSGESGPGYCVVLDPDGNPVLFDQHNA